MLHVTFLTLLRALKVNIDLRHVNHIRYYYYFYSQITLTPCLSLVIFISETSVAFVISFLFLQLQRLPIHSSPENLIIVIDSTMTFRKLTWTKYSAYKILWLVSLKINQNLNTLHQYSKNYIGFQSNNASITNCVFLHIKRFKFSNLPIFTIVFLFLLTLCLQDHLIHRFCPSHMSEHLWVKGPLELPPTCHP